MSTVDIGSGELVQLHRDASQSPSREYLRLAVLSDVHGNTWALEAVIRDVERHDPDGFVFLGDLLADGPDPVGTLALLQALPNTVFVQGNTDRYLADLSQVVPPRSAMPDLVATWQWAVDRLGEEGRCFLAGLPTNITLETPAGRVLATHGIPGDDEGFIDPARVNTFTALDWDGARLLLVGHTHRPFTIEARATGPRIGGADSRMGVGTIVNPGSVGIPTPTGWRASYAILDLYSAGQIAVQHAQVTWDIKAYVAAFEDRSSPNGGGIPLNRKAAPMLETLRRQTSGAPISSKVE